MKKVHFLGMLCLMALFLGAVVCCTEKENNDNTNGNNVVTNGDNNGGDNGGDNGGNNGGDTTIVNNVWVDLGLPSGTKWKNENELNAADSVYNFYTYDEAVAAFGNSLPTKEQFQELIDECEWWWNNGKYMVIGPNGNSIILPANGWRNGNNGNVGRIGLDGNCWSSTPNGADAAWRLGFDSDGKNMISNIRYSGYSVRLVQNQ